MTLTRSQARVIMQRHGLSPRRALGQNFVVDPNTVRRIARLAEVGEGDHVAEVGPGLGSLTLALADTGAEVVAVEMDSGLVGALEEVLAEPIQRGAVSLVCADAMELDWDEVLDRRLCWVLVANLPYNVATPVVLDLLDFVPQIRRMLVMVQREVGERLTAPVGSGEYGIPTVKVAYHATAEIVGSVPATVFDPVPRVASVLVSLRRRDRPPTEADPDVLFSLVRQAFGQRRKMLRRSLAGRVDAAQFEAAGLSPTARPQELDVCAWGTLALAVSEGS